MLSLSVQANYTEPPPQIRLGPYAHAYMIGPTQFRNMLNFIKIKGPLDYYKMWWIKAILPIFPNSVPILW
jgi:hypothetical protein